MNRSINSTLDCLKIMQHFRSYSITQFGKNEFFFMIDRKGKDEFLEVYFNGNNKPVVILTLNKSYSTEELNQIINKAKIKRKQ